MDDLISRRAAIDALYTAAEHWNIAEPYHEGMRTGFLNAARIVLSLPSAQSYTDGEIQTMQDLEQAQLDKAYELGWEEGREALRREIWEDERDRLN